MKLDTQPALQAPSAELVRRLRKVVGDANALTDAEAQAPHLREWRDKFTGKAALVLKPGSTAEVSQILALANEARVGIVPQAGNTGLVGGQIPDASGHEIVLSVERLRKVRGVDTSAASMVVEAGLTLAEAKAEADRAGRLFPLSMASEGSCRIGGNLATNAGGVAVLAYGNARNQVLGLEVVLADGRVWDGLKALKKDNTGYDLRDLFIGSEGTLGVITAATLRLLPRPRDTSTALFAVREADDVPALFRLAEERAGPSLTAFEFMSRRALEFVLAHMPRVRPPFSGVFPWLVLAEISAHEEGGAQKLMDSIAAAVSEQGLVSDAVIAMSVTQSEALWRLREGVSEAQKFEGGSIKHDVSLPQAAITLFLRRADALVERLCPGARPVPFGHFGDGNVHYNVSQPVAMDKARFLDLWPVVSDAVHDLVIELGGSISAEHGIGQLKREMLVRAKGAVELMLMRQIKQALDPRGILNPGKLL